MSINVGKIVTSEASSSPYDSQGEESISIGMTEQYVMLSVQGDSHRDSFSKPLTSAQAIELGQLLLKAAEMQPEYATEAAHLREEAAKLAIKYKDMISGLGLETEVDIVDARGTFKVIEAST